MRIAICDDNLIFCEATSALIQAWSKETGCPVQIYCFDNGDALLAKAAAVPMDIIFLDIIMPLLSGMSTARELRNTDRSTKIIFLTSTPDFALEAYDVKAFGYLLKPIGYDRMKQILDDCLAADSHEPKNMVLKTLQGYRKIYLHNIEYAEAQNKKVKLHLRTAENLEIPEPLYLLESKLTEQDGFFKCHRSYLVNLHHVECFTGTEITTKTGAVIPIARSCSREFQDACFLFYHPNDKT